MAARVGGAFIDLTGIFKDVDGQIYTDYTHLTPRGQQVDRPIYRASASFRSSARELHSLRLCDSQGVALTCASSHHLFARA